MMMMMIIIIIIIMMMMMMMMIIIIIIITPKVDLVSLYVIKERRKKVSVTKGSNI